MQIKDTLVKDHCKQFLFVVETKTKSLKGSEPEVDRKSHGQGYRNFILIYRFNASMIIVICNENVNLRPIADLI